MPYTITADTDGAVIADTDGALFWTIWEPLLGFTEATRPFYVAEITAYEPSVGEHVIYVSDLGYRTTGTPVQTYPPLLQNGLEIQARVPLDPAQVGAVWAWGELRIINAILDFDTIALAWNSDARDVVIKRGVKTWDDTRGLWIDPTYASLVTVFAGLAQPWRLDETELVVPLRGPEYWLEKPWARPTYGGTGGYDGTLEMAGTAIPITRGDAFNVPLTLIDDVNNIWQWSDGPGSIAILYEGGAANLVPQGITTNLYAGTTNPGYYRTDESRSLIQLGSVPATGLALTANVRGRFPTAGTILNLILVARYLMTETIGVPVANVDTTSFADAAVDYPWSGGVYFAPEDQITGLDAVMRCVSSIYGKIVPSLTGAIKLFMLRAFDPAATPVAYYTTAEIVRLTPRALPTSLHPPPKRLRVNWHHNYVVQTSGLSSSTPPDHRQFVALADRVAIWESATVAAAWRNASDPPAFGGYVQLKIRAQAVADEVGELYQDGVHQYDMTVPDQYGFDREYGDIIHVTHEFGDLDGGKKMQIIGRSLQAGDATVTLTVIDR
jgi:hypothetical protein